MTTRIKDIADIQIGYQFRKGFHPNPYGTHWVIQVRDIDERHNHRLMPDNMERTTPKSSPAKYLVRNGDVLFLSKGRRNSATMVEGLPEDNDTIAAGYFFIVRPDTDCIRSDYLAWTINGLKSQAYLQNVARGSGMPFVAKGSFASMAIDLPDLETQHEIVKLYELSAHESRLLERLQQKRSELIQGICTNAARETSRPAKE